MVRQNFDSKCEKAINKQIKDELEASYVYMAMVREQAEYTYSTRCGPVQVFTSGVCFRLMNVIVVMLLRPACFASSRRPASKNVIMQSFSWNT